MKKRYLIGFIITTAAIVTLAGCAWIAETNRVYEFPEEFRGTWKREGIDNTLTITAKTYILSHQQEYWILDYISNNTYFLFLSTDHNWKGREIIRFINGNLVIGQCRGSDLDQCAGTWIKQ